MTRFLQTLKKHSDNTRVYENLWILTAQFTVPANSAYQNLIYGDSRYWQARIGEFHRGNIQPNIYKAPEVLFDIEWSFNVDIWNVGVMAWDMFEDRHLFNALNEDRQYSPSHHVAERVAYLGLPLFTSWNVGSG
ncbi:protein kinase domain protein [Penicillium alfredii]|uniref:Protein kinase domain protein n=1 Tax=Penicillium alfredii TaxID=1506179 RepID=A0A9W9GAZ8_9EURO|nr:protein kinase domain protein [Penicillium alfredii]KAJ5115341.1 protein kinase domain protein [Penicillium alfredii]